MLDPLPRRHAVCCRLFLPRRHRPSPWTDGSASRVCPANDDFSQVLFSRVQVFRNVPASKFARPPDRSYRCKYCRRAAGASTSGPLVLCCLRTVWSGAGAPVWVEVCVPCCLALSVARCHSITTVPRFQSPPRRTQRVDFPHYAHLLASHQGLWDLTCWSDFRLWSSHPIAVEQLQVFVQPLPTPPLPPEALTLP